jgi:RHS repeat-associated protein
VSAKLANAAVYNYGINGLGQRVSKSGTAVSTGRQIYVYDEAGHLIGEYNNSGTRLWEHVYLGDLPVAVIGSAGGVFPVLSDHLGTPRQVINASKQLRWKWDNTEPFGANAANQNPANLGVFAYNLRFPGQYFDSETGLHYNYFRDYNPSTGRYIQSDPIGLSGGLNTYSYVANNPLLFIDPTGEGIPGKLCKLFPQCKAVLVWTVKKVLDACGKWVDKKVPEWIKKDEPTPPKKSAEERPNTREDLDIDLKSKGYTKTSTSSEGYVTYKGQDGRVVTVKPTGEVIPTQRVWKEDGSGKFPQRQDYEGNPLPDQSHSTGHYVEPF